MDQYAWRSAREKLHRDLNQKIPDDQSRQIASSIVYDWVEEHFTKVGIEISRHRAEPVPPSVDIDAYNTDRARRGIADKIFQEGLFCQSFTQGPFEMADYFSVIIFGSQRPKNRND